MAAVIDLRTGSAVAPQTSAQRRPTPRPQLTLLEGGRSAAALQQRRTYLRRRALALVLVAGMVLGVFASAAWVVGRAAAPSSADSVVVHRVQPGDTLWGVAATVDPQADPRTVVEQIVELNSAPGGSAAGFSANDPLQVGQELRVPARRS